MSQRKQANLLESIELQRFKEAIVRRNFVNSSTVQEDHRFLFQRVLGHKHDLPNMHKWTEVSSFTSPPGLRNDWLSSHQKYTLIFWSISHAEQQMKQLQVDQSQVRQLASLLTVPSADEIEKLLKSRPNQMPGFKEAYNDQFKFLDYLDIKDPSTHGPPLWAGSLTNWKYMPMFRADEFIQMLDPEFKDPFNELKSEGQFGRSLVNKIKDLSRAEFQGYLERRVRLTNQYRQDFRSLLDKFLKCTNPQLINFEEFQSFFRSSKIESFASKKKRNTSILQGGRKSIRRQSIETHLNRVRTNGQDSFDQTALIQEERILEHLEFCFPGLTDDEQFNNQVWVAVALAPPGKHQFVVKYEKLDCVGVPHSNVSFHTCLVTSQGQNLKTGAQKPKQSEAVDEPQFSKAESIFQDWNPDTEFVLNFCFQSDIEHIKFSQILKIQTPEGEKELGECKTAIRRQMALVKEVFVQQASLSQFPCIDLPQIQKFVVMSSLDKLIQPNEVKQLFEEADQGSSQINNPANALQRFEFIEFLLRLAKKKFVDTKIMSNLAQAYTKLVYDFIQPVTVQTSLQNFRHRYLWTTEANNVLNHHRDHLEKIYEVMKAKHPRQSVIKPTVGPGRNLDNSLRKDSIASSHREGNGSKMSMSGSRPDAATVHNARMANLMTLNDALSLLCDPKGLGLTMEQAKVCYASSKMTVINENPAEDQMMYHTWGQGTLQSSHEYHYLRFCEFIELVGRVAQIKYEPFYSLQAPICQLTDDDYTFANFLEFTVIKLIGNVLKVRAFPRRDLEEDLPSCSDSD